MDSLPALSFVLPLPWIWMLPQSVFLGPFGYLCVVIRAVCYLFHVFCVSFVSAVSVRRPGVKVEYILFHFLFINIQRWKYGFSYIYKASGKTHFISSLFCTPFYLFSPFLCRLSFSLFILSPHTAITPSYNVSTPLSKWPGNTRTGSRGIKGRINILTGLPLFSLPVHVSCPTHTHTQPCHLPSTFIHLPQDSPSLWQPPQLCTQSRARLKGAAK